MMCVVIHSLSALRAFYTLFFALRIFFLQVLGYLASSEARTETCIQEAGKKSLLMFFLALTASLHLCLNFSCKNSAILNKSFDSIRDVWPFLAEPIWVFLKASHISYTLPNEELRLTVVVRKEPPTLGLFNWSHWKARLHWHQKLSGHHYVTTLCTLGEVHQ